MFGREQHPALRQAYEALREDTTVLRDEVRALTEHVAALKQKLRDQEERSETLRLTVVGFDLRLNRQANETAELAAALMDRIDRLATPKP